MIIKNTLTQKKGINKNLLMRLIKKLFLSKLLLIINQKKFQNEKSIILLNFNIPIYRY